MDAEKDKFDALLSRIGTALGVLGGTVAVFYAVGFIVVQCFISSADIAGMFWFSHDYYEEAGGKFLVEIIRTPLMKPMFFVLYLMALVYLIPSEDIIKLVRPAGEEPRKKIAEISFRQKIGALIFLIIAASTYFIVAYFDRLVGSKFFVDNVMPVFFWSGETPNEQRNILIFFSLTVPVVIALGIFLVRLFRDGKSTSFVAITLSLYILFVSILPISYGRHLYDIKAVPISDPKRLYEVSGIKSDITKSSRMWFLGRFGGKYLFIRKDNLITNQPVDINNIALDRTDGIVESVNEADVKNMNFALDRADSLRELMKPSKGGKFRQDAQQVFDTAF